MYIDQLIQLHESIEIWYSVEPMYTAQLFAQDGYRKVAEATGESIQGALENLNKLVEEQKLTFEQVRKR